jgi:hypothetical protein
MKIIFFWGLKLDIFNENNEYNASDEIYHKYGLSWSIMTSLLFLRTSETYIATL